MMNEQERLDQAEAPLHGFRGDEASSDQDELIPLGPSIAITRETGARGGTIGRRVGKRLGWQVYDQETIQFLSNDPSSLLEVPPSLMEKAGQWIETQMESLAARHALKGDPTLEGVIRVVLNLAVRGNVVLIGRGAGFFLPSGSRLHVRLVAPLPERVSYISQWLRLTPSEAEERARQRDQQRAEYLQSVLGSNPNDVRNYDMVLSSHELGEDLCVDLISQAARAMAERHGRSDSDQGIHLEIQSEE